MVPGMTERERQNAEMRRLAWLADARLGPVRVMGAAPRPPAGTHARPRMVLDCWRLASAAVRALGQRANSFRFDPGATFSRRATANR